MANASKAIVYRARRLYACRLTAASAPLVDPEAAISTKAFTSVQVTPRYTNTPAFEPTDPAGDAYTTQPETNRLTSADVLITVGAQDYEAFELLLDGSIIDDCTGPPANTIGWQPRSPPTKSRPSGSSCTPT